ncbi:MAG: hypothetical protein ABI429_05665 [Jatrophihabitantaceae bacterium]
MKLGVDGCRELLTGGVNDLGGTLMEETISRMAGSQHASAKIVAQLEEIVGGLPGRTPACATPSTASSATSGWLLPATTTAPGPASPPDCPLA